MKKRIPFLLLFFIIFVGGTLRFTYVNWDSFQAFHPDERNISSAVVKIKFFSQMNPKFFAYGGLPIYLYRAIGEVVVRITGDPIWLADWGHIAVIGRSVSAVLSTLSLFLIYLVGSLYFSASSRGRWASGPGLVSAAFLAFSPWAIREAHFATTETMLVFFILVLLVMSHKLLHIDNRTRSMGRIGVLVGLVGFTWGLAIAAKTTSFMFGLIPFAALWLPILDKKTLEHHFVKTVFKKFLLTLILLAITSCIFFLFSPYTVLDFKHFQESMNYEGGVVFGRFTVPYTLQFLSTPPYLYQIGTMFWQAGPVAIAGLVGLIALIISLFYKHTSRFTNNELRITNFVFLIFPLVYFGFVGHWFAKFNRYNVPFLPFVTLAATWLCIAFIKRFRLAGLAFTALLLATTSLWGFANWTIYLRPQTRIAASKWIYANIPPTALLYTEHWNDGLPLDLPNTDIHYHRELLNVYDDPDDEKKRLYYADKLTVGDYIIFSTRRIWATMPNLTVRYPVTSVFYKKLLAGDLGYTEVASFASFPQLFGVVINDDHVEESIQVFDHPTVRIFQNIKHFSSQQIYLLLQ